jgi:DnaJ-class molecular chaperone
MKRHIRALWFIALFSCFGCMAERQLREIDCSECKGKGSIVYDSDHPLVVKGLVKVGTADTCWACRGQGRLLVECK